jgi:hypothetical protein
VTATNRTVVVCSTPAPPVFTLPGIYTNSFGFTITAGSGQTVVVETCTNLAAPAWVPIQTNVLGSSPVAFRDSSWTNRPRRFYRLLSP